MTSFRLNRIYTRSGDQGDTSLVDGSRVGKDSLRPEAYGTLDELNSCLGICKETLKSDLKFKVLKEVIEYLQQELFDLGSELATPPGSEYPNMWKVSAVHVKKLEDLCDHFNENLPELQSFILPGGSMLAAHLHLARTIARRAERVVVKLSRDEASTENTPAVSEFCLQYINRISDLLFILARYVLAEEHLEAPLWVSEKERRVPV